MEGSSATFDRVRHSFSVLRKPVNGKRLAWLDSASTTLKPDCVIEAVSACCRDVPANVHRSVHSLGQRATDAYEGAREAVRGFINAASADEIVFTRGTTESINLLASCAVGSWLSPDDEILISELEHHSNIVPWQFLRDRTGIRLGVIPVTDTGDVTVDALRRCLTPRTRLVAVSAVSNAIGTQLPLEDMIAVSHRAGARVMVDAAQAVGGMPVDVRALDCDFLAFSGHKMFAPTGIGVLYGKRDLLDRMPPYQGGGDMIRSVTFEQTRFNDVPFRFEAGTPNIVGAVGLGRAIGFIREIGFEAMERHEQGLIAYAKATLDGMEGIRLVGRPVRQRHVLSFVMDHVHAHDAGTLLDEDGVAVRAGHHCAQPLMRRFGVPATVRVSFSVYNTMEDIEQLADSLKRIKGIFA